MVVKSKVGRKRYVVFRINTNIPVSKSELIKTINYEFRNLKSNGKNNKNDIEKSGFKLINTFNSRPWVIFIKDNYGLIRCHHLDAKRTIEFLKSLNEIKSTNHPIEITTLGITGTIKRARKKYLDKYFLYPLNNYIK